MLYEFIALLVRIAFQRANPTFGNFGNKKAIVHLVNFPNSGMTGEGCLKSMIEEEILPRARKDTSAVFRETVMTEKSVLQVLDVSCCAPRDSKLDRHCHRHYHRHCSHS